MVAPVQAGEIIARKYRVERVLGEGGMGVVVGARHIHLDELVAIKLLRADVGKNEKVVERFMREARMASKIKSEHVARVSDVDTLDSGEPYIVMEYLRGRDLQSIAAQSGPLDVEEAVDYLLQACDAIAEAHGRGIVHRDLKPANLFLAQRPNGSLCVKVLDFGISKLSEQTAQADVTSTATLLGSPVYMSPEQMRSSREVDARTDIWSLGVTLYQLVTGKLPFSGETVAAVHGLVQYTEPARPCELRSDLSLDLEAIILRCLEKDPAKRFQTVIDLACELVPFGPEGAKAPEDRFSAPIPLSPVSVQIKPPPGDDDKPTLVTPHAFEAAPTLRVGKPMASSGTPIIFDPEEDDEPPTYLPKRWGVGWFVALGLLLVALAGGFVFFRLMAQKSVDSGRPSATGGAIQTQVDMLSPTSTAPPVAPAVSTVAAADSAAARAAPSGDAKGSAAATRPAQVKPVVTSGGDKAKVSTKEGSPPPIATVAPPVKGPTGLDTEKCFAQLPDGTRKEVPCP